MVRAVSCGGNGQIWNTSVATDVQRLVRATLPPASWGPHRFGVFLENGDELLDLCYPRPQRVSGSPGHRWELTVPRIHSAVKKAET